MATIVNMITANTAPANMVKRPWIPSTSSSTGFILDRMRVEHISRVINTPAMVDLISTGIISADRIPGITL